MPLRTNSPLPSLEGATEWLNSPLDAAALQGSPLLVHFWSLGCYICHQNVPTLDEWKAQFGPRGLKFVAFHMPRSEAELDVDAVRADLAQMHIDEPCGIDNAHEVADAFENQFVPAYFLFDAEGKLRSRTAGDAGLKNMEATLRRLLELPAGT